MDKEKYKELYKSLAHIPGATDVMNNLDPALIETESEIGIRRLIAVGIRVNNIPFEHPAKVFPFPPEEKSD